MEALKVGDLAVTLSGANRPIRRLCPYTIESRYPPHEREALPVRFSAGAFGSQTPTRDLFVSPRHCVSVDIVGETLIPAIALVNGATAQQVDVDVITYWQIELEDSDVILAEGLSCASNLSQKNQLAVVADEGAKVFREFDHAPRNHAHSTLSHFIDGPLVDVVRSQMRAQAIKLGWKLCDALHAYLEVDGLRVDAVVRAPMMRFLLPADAKEVWLVSPTARPYDTLGINDHRTLGLDIVSLSIGDGFSMSRGVAIDEPSLCVGFWQTEKGTHRWTNGRAKLPAPLWRHCRGAFFLRIELGSPPPERWVAPHVGKDDQDQAWGECLLRGRPWAQSRTVPLSSNSLPTSTESEPRSLRGFIDFFDGRRLIGWAQDQADPEQRVRLEFVVGGRSIARTRADKFRGDLLARKVGDGCHGFDLRLEAPLPPQLSHNLVMQRLADGVIISSATCAPKRITLEPVGVESPERSSCRQTASDPACG